MIWNRTNTHAIMILFTGLLLMIPFMSWTLPDWGSHRSTDEKNPKYTVYFFLGEDCRICHYYSKIMNDLHTDYASDSLQFVGLFPNRYSTEEGIEQYQDKYKITFPLKREFYGTKAKKFGVQITPEVVIFNNDNQEIVYKGRIDDSYVKVGRRRQVILQHDLQSALSSIVNGIDVDTKETKAVGCYITFFTPK